MGEVSTNSGALLRRKNTWNEWFSSGPSAGSQRKVIRIPSHITIHRQSAASVMEWHLHRVFVLPIADANITESEYPIYQPVMYILSQAAYCLIDDMRDSHESLVLGALHQNHRFCFMTHH
jgi:hypothetical protein